MRPNSYSLSGPTPAVSRRIRPLSVWPIFLGIAFVRSAVDPAAYRSVRSGIGAGVCGTEIAGPKAHSHLSAGPRVVRVGVGSCCVEGPNIQLASADGAAPAGRRAGASRAKEARLWCFPRTAHLHVCRPLSPHQVRHMLGKTHFTIDSPPCRRYLTYSEHA